MAAESRGQLTIALPEQLEDAQLHRCAELVFDAGRGYYDLLGVDRSLVEVEIAKQIARPGTELERMFVGLVGVEVAGLHACVSTGVLPAVMMEGTLTLLRGMEHGIRRDFLERLRRARPALPPLPDHSLYLARLAVADDHQGLGVADALMHDFFERRENETSHCLHVLTDNARALGFFRRLGFERFGTEAAGFLSMVRAVI